MRVQEQVRHPSTGMQLRPQVGPPPRESEAWQRYREAPRPKPKHARMESSQLPHGAALPPSFEDLDKARLGNARPGVTTVKGVNALPRFQQPAAGPIPERTDRTTPMPAWTAGRKRVAAAEDAIAQQLAREQAEQEKQEAAARAAAKFIAKQAVPAAPGTSGAPSHEGVFGQAQHVAGAVLRFLVDAGGTLIPHHLAQRHHQQRAVAPSTPPEQPMQLIEGQARRAVDAMQPAPQPTEYYPYPQQSPAQPQREQQPAQQPAPERSDTPLFHALWQKFFQHGRGRAASQATKSQAGSAPFPSSDFLLRDPNAPVEQAAAAVATAIAETALSGTLAQHSPFDHCPQTAFRAVTPTQPHLLASTMAPIAPQPEMRPHYEAKAAAVSMDEITATQTEQPEPFDAFRAHTPSSETPPTYTENSTMANLGLFIDGTRSGQAAAGQQK